jgi:formylmethanofuran dehydrogenase subunit B
MSHSMYDADRNTHIKVVSLGLFCAVVVVIVGFTARVSDVTVAGANSGIEADRTVIRAGGPAAVTSNAQKTIR